jgi:hypothetical protein
MASLDRLTIAMLLPSPLGVRAATMDGSRPRTGATRDVRAAWAYAADIVKRHEGDPDAALALTLTVRERAHTPYMCALADALLSAWGAAR